MEAVEGIESYLDHITKDVMEVRKMIVHLNVVNRKKTLKAWKDLRKASNEISKLWHGLSAVDEIRMQREK